MKLQLIPPLHSKGSPNWTTQTFSRSESNLVNEPIKISPDKTCPLPETLSLPSTETLSLPSTSLFTGLTTSTTFLTKFQNQLNDRCCEKQETNKPLRLDWNSFVAPLYFLDNTLKVVSSIIGHWVDYIIDTKSTKIIKIKVIKILSQQNLFLRFETIVKLENFVHHSLPLSQPVITVQSLPNQFITTELVYKYDRYTKKTIGRITFYNRSPRLSYTCIFLISFHNKFIFAFNTLWTNKWSHFLLEMHTF